MTAVEFQYSLIGLQKILLKFAFGLTDDRNDARDLVQETYLKALIYCNKFDHASNLKAWTFTIMKNTFINNYRHKNLHNSTNYPLDDQICFNYIHYSNADIPDSIYRSIELEKTIEALDVNFKIPFKMYHEGYRYKEIATTLDLNIGTVKSRIFHARKQLMAQLNE